MSLVNPLSDYFNRTLKKLHVFNILHQIYLKTIMEIIDQLIIDLLKENKIDAETAVRLLKAIYRDSKEVQPQYIPYIPYTPNSPQSPTWPGEWTTTSTPTVPYPIVTYTTACSGRCDTCKQHCTGNRNNQNNIINE